MCCIHHYLFSMLFIFLGGFNFAVALCLGKVNFKCLGIPKEKWYWVDNQVTWYDFTIFKTISSIRIAQATSQNLSTNSDLSLQTALQAGVSFQVFDFHRLNSTCSSRGPLVSSASCPKKKTQKKVQVNGKPTSPLCPDYIQSYYIYLWEAAVGLNVGSAVAA